MFLRLTAISLRAKSKLMNALFEGSVEMDNRFRSEILYFFCKIDSIAVVISSFCIVAKKPNLPVLMPIIGIPKSFTKVIARKIVPSPPILINRSYDLFNSLNTSNYL